MMNIDALQQAIMTLKGSGLKLWLYLNKNQENYRFELSRKACEEWGIKKDSYYDGIKDLIAHGYLRLSQPGSNIYYFHENALAEKPTSGYSDSYFTENPNAATILFRETLWSGDNQFGHRHSTKYQNHARHNKGGKQNVSIYTSCGIAEKPLLHWRRNIGLPRRT